MRFLVRVDFMPTVYVDAHEQAIFPVALISTNNVAELCSQLQASKDLF